jgi:hypothetical protein
MLIAGLSQSSLYLIGVDTHVMEECVKRLPPIESLSSSPSSSSFVTCPFFSFSLV